MKSRKDILGALEAAEIRDNIFKEMLRTRSHKYKWWLLNMSAMRRFAILMGQRDRAEVVVSLYTALHFADDVVDTDAPLPNRYSSGAEYVLDKMHWVANPSKPRDDVECLLAHSFDLAESIGENLCTEVNMILASMLFDAERRNPMELKVFRRQVIQEHFHRLDISGTIGLCLKLFNETGICGTDLIQLGEASRIYLTIRDMTEDFQAGYCNIPLEDVERLGIDVFDSSSSSVQMWRRKEAGRGLALLNRHRARIRNLPLRRFTRTVLPPLYEWPARKYFRQVVKETEFLVDSDH